MQALCCLKLLAIRAELLCAPLSHSVSQRYFKSMKPFLFLFLFVCKGPSELCGFSWEIKRLANVTLIPS